jgi:beta-phosphoglucomutase
MPIGLATGSRRSDVTVVLEHLEDGALADCFTAIVTSDDVRLPKPDPETYQRAVQGIDQSPASCLAIEDTPAGIAAAQGAGLRVIGVAGSHDPESLKTADRVIPSLEGVTVEDLRRWFEGL